MGVHHLVQLRDIQVDPHTQSNAVALTYLSLGSLPSLLNVCTEHSYISFLTQISSPI